MLSFSATWRVKNNEWTFFAKDRNQKSGGEVLKPIIKEASVNDSERILTKVATTTFFSLWSYPSLFRDVDGGKEVADLTVYFNNTLILFSDKGEVRFQTDRPTDIAWKRWYRSAVKDSAKQLHGAESFIRKYPDRIYLNQKCKDPFPFDISNPDLKIHLVCVTRGIGTAAKEYFDSLAPGSAGTLISHFPLNEYQILEHPFTVNDIDPSKTFVHVLDETGINLLLTELSTPTDFINYLAEKEKAVRKLKLVIAGGEEDILAYYLLEPQSEGYGSIPNPGAQFSTPFMIHETLWSQFRDTIAYALHFAQNKQGRGWAGILERFSDCIINATVGEAADRPLIEHSKVLEFLASENMYSRAFLSKSLFDKFGLVPELVRSARIVESLCYPNRMYVFVFFPWDDEYADYQDYREERLSCMQLYALVTQYKYPKVKELIVFGADTKGSSAASETIIAFDASIPLTSEERAQAQSVMRTFDVLHGTTETKTKHPCHAGIKRNDPCPCGSGKKYKKCCC
ncbi:SEC-C domain-containing protein [Pseudomonas sp. FP1742]|uniref:SEC-C domain-containing protein n=1 Tax=Pseudomonas sp. FP1742 TaxID=2954079 RepID=UPI002732A448|nr:SEC-C domain-containing protein [Pseudomonas sp. FP1742]WLG48624.1 SEC-C domain-containing protein [Pseudomonas sp. FP1742]